MTLLSVTLCQAPEEAAPEETRGGYTGALPSGQAGAGWQEHIIRPSEPTLFSLQGLSFWYGQKRALAEVSMEFPVNKVTALIGPSGCGKSTLLRCLNRMNDLIPGVRVDGAVEYHGQDIYASDIDPVEVRRRIGMVFQKPNPFPKSIYQNIVFGARVNGYNGNLDELVERSLRQAALWTEVSGDLKKSGLALSGGQQQRLCIARALAVQPDGSVVFPLIGSVPAGGATTAEVERQISTRLAKGLIRDAHVSVTVQQYRSKLVFVVGEVSRPGAYPLAGETRIVEILARAGPLTKDASSDILVVRPTEQVERPVLPAQVKVRDEQRAGGHGLPAGQVLRVDVRAIQAGRLDENLVLEPNDTVFVPLAEQVFVTGEVRSPGAVPFRRGITARQAVALAGGFSDDASTGSVHVVRDVIGTSRTLKVRLDERLQAGDTVVVKKAWF